MSDKSKDLVKTIIFSAAIIIASLILAFAINKGARYIGDPIGNGLSFIGINMPAAAIDRESQFGEFMSSHEASLFLSIQPYDLQDLIDLGELSGTYTVVADGYVFSKEKLTQWAENRIENE